MSTMKRKILFLLSVFLYLQSIYAQDNFTVIKVSGNIVIERTGSSLGTGTSFAQNENLLFKIPESRAAVINPRRGRFLLTSETLSEFKNSKSNFLPAAGKTSTRGVSQVRKVTDLKKLFEGNCVILNNNIILIDTTIYPLNDKRYFYLTYEYNSKTINKKLKFHGDTLLLKKEELLAVNGKVISDPGIKEMKLMYLVEDKSYEPILISSFTPVFPDTKTLSKEVKIITDQMEMNPYREKLNEISSYINEFYGKIDDNNLQKWLDDNLSLKR